MNRAAKNSRRTTLAKRHGNKCAYCGIAKNLTLDHRTPKSRGGTNAVSNLALACFGCNHQKGDMTEAEFLRWIHRHPRWRRDRIRQHLDQVWADLDKCSKGVQSHRG